MIPAASTNVVSVITALEINRPGMSVMKRNLLLLFCQGHFLALGGKAMFAEDLYATDRGVRVDSADGPIVQPSNGVLNIINDVLARYGGLSPADLRTLIQVSTPWRQARKSPADPRIEPTLLRDWFTRPDENDDPDDDRPDRATMAEAMKFLKGLNH